MNSAFQPALETLQQQLCNGGTGWLPAVTVDIGLTVTLEFQWYIHRNPDFPPKLTLRHRGTSMSENAWVSTAEELPNAMDLLLAHFIEAMEYVRAYHAGCNDKLPYWDDDDARYRKLEIILAPYTFQLEKARQWRRHLMTLSPEG